MSSPIDDAAMVIRRAQAILITAGAGMGVDSGLPDFRGPHGFWKAYPPYRALGLNFAQLANPRWFRDDPQLAWGFYGHRLHLYRQTQPHAGFAILRRWCERFAQDAGARIFTSNVDGHFQKAGFSGDHITEIHGSIHHLQCAAGCTSIWPADETQIAVDHATFRATGELPRCPTCGALARPNILMFGDSGWISARTEKQERSLDAWLASLGGMRVIIIECGAGSAVPTVRRHSEYVAEMLPATLVRINVREPEVTPGHIGIPLNAAEALAAIDRKI